MNILLTACYLPSSVFLCRTPRATDTQSVRDTTQERQHLPAFLGCWLPLVNAARDKWHSESPPDHILAEGAWEPKGNGWSLWHSSAFHSDTTHHITDLLLPGEYVTRELRWSWYGEDQCWACDAIDSGRLLRQGGLGHQKCFFLAEICLQTTTRKEDRW